MKHILRFLSLSALVLLLVQCSDDKNPTELSQPNLPGVEYDYLSTQDTNGQFFSDNTPNDNQMTDAGATLGRVLFYDKNLSINNTVSCASCHKQELAFSDNVAKSVGFGGVKTTRNSPPIMNMRSSNFFFWDFSESSLEQQVVTPIANHIEMGMEDMDFLIEKLNGVGYYNQLFKKAFNTTQITEEGISKAMAQFLRSITSLNSRFDVAFENNMDGLTALETLGSEVFMESGCNSCHTVMGNSFFDFENSTISIVDGGFGYGGTGTATANIGLDIHSADQGAGNGAFKVPSLRNLAFTAPYMHDGRFRTIDEVIEHYNTGVKAHDNLDFRLKDINGNPLRLNLTPVEINALKAFLMTLTDTELLEDPKYSDPFEI